MQGGFLLLVAGYKGYGLALTIALLTGAVGGWRLAPEIVHPYKDLAAPGDNSYAMVALKLDCFCTAEAFRRRTDEGVRLIRGTPGAPGVNRGWLRAEKEAETERDRREHHVPLAEGTLEEIRELADDLGVSLAL